MAPASAPNVVSRRASLGAPDFLVAGVPRCPRLLTRSSPTRPPRRVGAHTAVADAGVTGSGGRAAGDRGPGRRGPLAVQPAGRATRWPCNPLAVQPAGRATRWPCNPLAVQPTGRATDGRATGGRATHWPCNPLAVQPAAVQPAAAQPAAVQPTGRATGGAQPAAVDRRTGGMIVVKAAVTGSAVRAR